VHRIDRAMHGRDAPGPDEVFEGLAIAVVSGLEQAREDRLVQRCGDQRVGQGGVVRGAVGECLGGQQPHEPGPVRPGGTGEVQAGAEGQRPGAGASEMAASVFSKAAQPMRTAYEL
jgi:hypothetical protein